MQKVSELVSKSVGDTLTNIKTWGPLMYNALEHGVKGDWDGVKGTDDTEAMQELVNKAIAEGRKCIGLPHTPTGGMYYVTHLDNADQVVFVGDNASFVGGFTGTINQLGTFGVPQEEFDEFKAETVLDLEQRAVNVDKFPIIHPEVTESGRITRAIDYAALEGLGIVIIPKGNRQLSTGIILRQGLTLFAYGAKLYNSTDHITILTLESDTKVFGLEIEGAGNSTAATNGVGILCSGTDAQNYRKSIVIEDCKIHDVGFYGIHGEWVEDLQINRSEIYNCGYAGVGLLSAVRCHLTKSYIHDISPGSAANAYGVYFSRRGNKTSLTDFPRSRDCSATDNIIENIPIWEALDSHGGDNILFSRNIIRNCKIGIALVTATDDAGASAYGIQNSKAIGNTIFGIGDGYGIVVKGVANDYACNNEIANNTLIECGQQGQALSGAIYTEFTKGLAVSANTLRNCYANGIHIFNENRSFSCTGNVVVDVQDNTFAAPACISFRSTNNDGVLSGNTLSRDNTSLNTYVSEIGINFSSATGIDVVVIGNKNNCVIPVNGGNGPHIKYGVHGNNMFKLVGTGSPEGVVTAPVGSEYTNTSGGAATTLYIKTSGTGNTGWTAK